MRAHLGMWLLASATASLVFADDKVPASASVGVLPASGDYHGDEVGYPSGPGWLALVTDGGASTLASVALKVGVAQDSIHDSNGGPFTGKSVAHAPSSNAIVLLQGQSLRAGPLVAASVATGRSEGLHPKKLSLGDRHYTLAIDKQCGPASSTCQWVLSDEGIEQTLYELRMSRGEDGEFVAETLDAGLLWAGDLDRDGKLDLVLDASDHYNHVAQIRVLLSSGAPPGKHVVEVGSFSAVGC